MEPEYTLVSRGRVLRPSIAKLHISLGLAYSIVVHKASAEGRTEYKNQLDAVVVSQKVCFNQFRSFTPFQSFAFLIQSLFTAIPLVSAWLLPPLSHCYQ